MMKRICKYRKWEVIMGQQFLEDETDDIFFDEEEEREDDKDL